mmetsp:Transcript_79184/g.149399  ORF Transcript_79184/g.149399 Transcript_79184/m.149399 type:complete len:98 (-) Transcript_79184:474-767(-)
MTTAITSMMILNTAVNRRAKVGRVHLHARADDLASMITAMNAASTALGRRAKFGGVHPPPTPPSPPPPPPPFAIADDLTIAIAAVADAAGRSINIAR